MSQGPNRGGGIDRRRFLLGLGAVAASGLPGIAVAETTESAAEILDWQKEVPAWFLESMTEEEKQDFSKFVGKLNEKEGQENMTKGNFEGFLVVGNSDKYRELSVPLIEEGLDIPQNLRKLRYLIYRELKRGYKYAASQAFREYDAEEVWDDKKFFGDIGNPEGGKYIDYNSEYQMTYDKRLEGDIGENPDGILSRLDKVDGTRLLEQETGDIAFIIKDRNGKDIFLYYEGGKLKYGFPTTVGAGDSTPSNLRVPTIDQILEDNQNTDRNIRSTSFTNSFLDDEFKAQISKDATPEEIEAENERIKRKKEKAINNGETIGGAMPYSRRLQYYDEETGKWRYDGHNTHIGNVSEYGESHGCARQTVLGAYIAFYGLKPGTLIYYRPELYLN